ncbi:hypothetical protein ALP93_200243 [Pseudomonas syringae pv. helianthi]|nr:hypothetical protein ALP93_200243 [Pseudomonas syringae pv. helianthi]
MLLVQRLDQSTINPPVGSGHCLGAGSINHHKGRQDPPLLTQTLQRLPSQQQASVGLLGQAGQLAYKGTEIR